METKLVDVKKMKSLEDYLIALITGLISLKTLEAFHGKAIMLGILKEDMECRANTLIWEFKRIEKLYHDQAGEVLDLLPEDMNLDQIMSKIAMNEIDAQKKLRKPRMKK